MQVKLPKNIIDHLVEGMRTQVSAAILDRGWDYYHRGFVRNMRLDGARLLASVRGTATYEVELDLERPGKGECSCPYGDWCKHRTAVVFAAYAAHARPEMLLIQMHKQIKTRLRQTRGAAGRSQGSNARTTVSPEEKPREWQAFFDQRFYGYTLSHQQSIEVFYQTAWDSLLPFAETWDPTLRDLYELHVAIFILRKIEHFYQVNQSSYLSYYHENSCRLVAAQCLERLREILRGISTKGLLQQYAKQLEDSAAFIHETALQGKTGAIDWLSVYRVLWWELFREATGLAEQEQRRLKQSAGQSGVTPRKQDVLALAEAHFDLMAGRDRDAMSRLDRLHARQVGDFFAVLQHLEERGEWERLLGWLRWLLPAMPRAKQEDFHAVCAYWVEAMKSQPSDEEWIRVMLAMLPRSYYYYTDYLMKTERYRQWVDLQLSNRISPANLFTDHLKAVESNDPSLLLPLYHQAVERSIQEKNRTSYKTAVRQLRKLNGFYKKLKKTDRWNEYIVRLAGKHSRLRAFQEELRKGNWLS